jgi:hypothetical protein
MSDLDGVCCWPGCRLLHAKLLSSFDGRLARKGTRESLRAQAACSVQAYQFQCERR